MVEVDQIGSKPDAKEEIEKGRVKIASVQGATISNDIFTNSFQIVLSCFPLGLHRFRYFSVIKPFGCPLF